MKRPVQFVTLCGCERVEMLDMASPPEVLVRPCVSRMPQTVAHLNEMPTIFERRFRLSHVQAGALVYIEEPEDRRVDRPLQAECTCKNPRPTRDNPFGLCRLHGWGRNREMVDRPLRPPSKLHPLVQLDEHLQREG